MKTILLAPLPPPFGGIASWAERMSKATLKDGWELEIIDEKSAGKVTFGKKSKRRFLREVKRCFRIWRQLSLAVKDPEVKIVHSCIPSCTRSMMREVVCALIAKKKGKRFIIHFHCTVPNTTQGRIGGFLLKRLCAKSNLIIALNRQSECYLKQITSTPVRIVPNFIEQCELKKDRVTRQECKNVVYVGGIVESKGVLNLLQVAKRMPELTFRFVGEGDSFDGFVKENNIKNAVFTGRKDKHGVEEELEKADVFAFLSFFQGEGFSVALTEAMAAGLPCLVTDWAANADMIGAEGGSVVPVGDINASVQALRSMIPYEIRKKQSDANIQKVESCYIDRIVLDRIIDAYEELL